MPPSGPWKSAGVEPAGAPGEARETEVAERCFCDSIDCCFPYDDRERASALVREACSISTTAAFCVASELARPPRSAGVTTTRLLELLDELSVGFEHPSKDLVLSVARRMAVGEELPVAESIALMGQLHSDASGWSALALILMSCDDVDGEAEAAYERTLGSWGKRPAPNGRLVVVVPTLDEAEDLPGLLGRLLDDCDPRDRADAVVIADGGSSDGTRELAAAAGALVIAADPGRGAQLQAGGAAALELLEQEPKDQRQGPAEDLLLFLHADNLPAPWALGALREEAARQPHRIAFGMSQRVDAEGRIYRMIERTADRRTARGMVYGDSGLAVRPGAYRAIGGYRPIPLFEDLDLSKRLAAQGEVGLALSARIRVNARRWKAEGALRTTLRNWILTVGWRLGVPPERLVRWYPRHGR